MAYKKKVYISDGALIASVQHGSAGVWKWRNKLLRSTEHQAKKNARDRLEMNPQNAMHRGGVVGTYLASFDKDKIGSNGWWIRGRVWNYAPHAYYVEHGRGPSKSRQVFSSTLRGWRPLPRGGMMIESLTGFEGVQYRTPGKVYTWYYTGSRRGKDILRDAGHEAARIHRATWIPT
jgi:hypothetical protein